MPDTQNRKVAAFPSNDELSAPRYSHSDALAVAAVSNEQLQTWYKRGILPDTSRTKGRGLRRKYSLFNLLHLALLRELADCSVPLLKASLWAIEIATLLVAVLRFQDSQKGRVGLPKLFLSITEQPDGFAYNVYSNDNTESLEEWVQQHHTTRLALIDLRRFLVTFHNALANLETPN